MRVQLVTLKTGPKGGPERTIAAAVFEGLAVGRTWSADGADGWNVTHIGTGLAIGPRGIYLRSEACRLVALLNYRACWDFSAAAFDAIDVDERKVLRVLANEAIAGIDGDMGRPEPPYWQELADNVGPIVGYEDNCLYVADVGPDGKVQGFNGYCHEHASLEDNWYLVNASRMYEVMGFSSGMRAADLPSEPIGLTPELAGEMESAYVTDGLSWCEYCEGSGDSENYGLGWVVVNDCTLACGSCYDTECAEWRVCPGCAHDVDACEHVDGCPDEDAPCEDCGAEGPIRGDCYGCGTGPLGTPSPRAPSPRVPSRGAEFDGMSHDEIKATLDARIATALAEYNPSVPIYRAA